MSGSPRSVPGRAGRLAPDRGQQRARAACAALGRILASVRGELERAARDAEAGLLGRLRDTPPRQWAPVLAELNDLLGTLDQARLAAQYSPEGRIRVDRTLAEVTPGQAFEAAWHGVSLVEPGPTLHVTRNEGGTGGDAEEAERPR